MRMNPVEAAIRNRRTAWGFLENRRLGDELLGQILDLAALAPSSFNLQPWRFVVVRSRSNHKKLMSCLERPGTLANASAIILVLAHLHPHRTHLDRILGEQVARNLISPDEAKGTHNIAFRAMENYADRATWAVRSAMMAASHLMLAAEGFGVATSSHEVYDVERLREMFGIPDDHAVCNAIALGFVDAPPPFPGRLDRDDLCYAEHFGQPWTAGAPRENS